MPQEQSTESNKPPYREWSYMVQLVGKSWAGTYSNSPFASKAGTTGDGGYVATGQGQEGRITGGVVEAYNETEVREKLDGLYILKEQDTVTQSYRLLSLEPRTILFTE